MFYNAQIEINIQDFGNASVYYSYNNYTTFRDFLEYLAFLIQTVTICECSKFYYKSNKNNNYYNSNNNYHEIKLDNKIYDYQYNLTNLYLSKNRNCYCNNSYLKYSKYYLKREITQLNSKIFLNEKEISNLEKDKNDKKNKIENLEKKNENKNIQIKNLKEEKFKQKSNINTLENKINDLNKDKKNFRNGCKRRS